MAADLDRYWYVAAVFRDSRDLAATVNELRADNFASGRLLVIANHVAQDTRQTLDANGGGDVSILPVHDGKIGVGSDRVVPAGLKVMVDAMDFSGSKVSAARAPSEPVYAQLRRDVEDGAMVLIASVAGPEEQLLGARIMLRGNCECVLTHEIAARGA